MTDEHQRQQQHGVSHRALSDAESSAETSLKPMASFAYAGSKCSRCVGSNMYTGSNHDPPATARRELSGCASASHSRTLPAISYQPNGLNPAGTEPTSRV